MNIISIKYYYKRFHLSCVYAPGDWITPWHQIGSNDSSTFSENVNALNIFYAGIETMAIGRAVVVDDDDGGSGDVVRTTNKFGFNSFIHSTNKRFNLHSHFVKKMNSV